MSPDSSFLVHRFLVIFPLFSMAWGEGRSGSGTVWKTLFLPWRWGSVLRRDIDVDILHVCVMEGGRCCDVASCNRGCMCAGRSS